MNRLKAVAAVAVAIVLLLPMTMAQDILHLPSNTHDPSKKSNETNNPLSHSANNQTASISAPSNAGNLTKEDHPNPLGNLSQILGNTSVANASAPGSAINNNHSSSSLLTEVKPANITSRDIVDEKNPCTNPNISACFEMIVEEMNKTEQMLKMANETLIRQALAKRPAEKNEPVFAMKESELKKENVSSPKTNQDADNILNQNKNSSQHLGNSKSIANDSLLPDNPPLLQLDNKHPIENNSLPVASSTNRSSIHSEINLPPIHINDSKPVAASVIQEARNAMSSNFNPPISQSVQAQPQDLETLQLLIQQQQMLNNPRSAAVQAPPQMQESSQFLSNDMSEGGSLVRRFKRSAEDNIKVIDSGRSSIKNNIAGESYMSVLEKQKDVPERKRRNRKHKDKEGSVEKILVRKMKLTDSRESNAVFQPQSRIYDSDMKKMSRNSETLLKSGSKGINNSTTTGAGISTNPSSHFSSSAQNDIKVSPMEVSKVSMIWVPIGSDRESRLLWPTLRRPPAKAEASSSVNNYDNHGPTHLNHGQTVNVKDPVKQNKTALKHPVSILPSAKQQHERQKKNQEHPNYHVSSIDAKGGNTNEMTMKKAMIDLMEKQLQLTSSSVKLIISPHLKRRMINRGEEKNQNSPIYFLQSMTIPLKEHEQVKKLEKALGPKEEQLFPEHDRVVQASPDFEVDTPDIIVRIKRNSQNEKSHYKTDSKSDLHHAGGHAYKQDKKIVPNILGNFGLINEKEASDDLKITNILSEGANDGENGDVKTDERPYPEFDTGVSMSNSRSEIQKLLAENDTIPPKITQDLQFALRRASDVQHELDQSSKTTLRQLEDNLRLLKYMENAMETRASRLGKLLISGAGTERKYRRKREVKFTGVLAQNQEQLQQLLQQQQNLLKMQQKQKMDREKSSAMEHEPNVLFSAVKKEPNVLDNSKNADSLKQSTENNTKADNNTNKANDAMSSKIGSKNSEEKDKKSLDDKVNGTNSSPKISDEENKSNSSSSSEGGIASFFSNLFGTSKPKNSTGGNITAGHNNITVGHSNDSKIVDLDHLNSSTINNSSNANETGMSDVDLSKLSKTDKEEAELESAPDGLILKVVVQGESNLAVGTLVDGNLNPIVFSKSKRNRTKAGRILEVTEVFPNHTSKGNSSSDKLESAANETAHELNRTSVSKMINEFNKNISDEKSHSQGHKNISHDTKGNNTSSGGLHALLGLGGGHKNDSHTDKDNKTSTVKPEKAATSKTDNTSSVISNSSAGHKEDTKKSFFLEPERRDKPSSARVLMQPASNPAVDPGPGSSDSGRLALPAPDSSRVSMASSPISKGNPVNFQPFLQPDEPNMLNPGFMQARNGPNVVRAERVKEDGPSHEDALFSSLHEGENVHFDFQQQGLDRPRFPEEERHARPFPLDRNFDHH